VRLKPYKYVCLINLFTIKHFTFYCLHVVRAKITGVSELEMPKFENIQFFEEGSNLFKNYLNSNKHWKS